MCPCGNPLPIDRAGSNGRCVTCNWQDVARYYNSKTQDMPDDLIEQDKQKLIERKNI